MNDLSLPDVGATRREFAQLLALAAAVPLAAGLGEARGQPPATLDKAGGIAARTLALTELIRSQYGRHLSAEQLAAVQRGIAGGLFTADRLARFPLTNADEPAFTFSADVR
jgi:hypothetical protein